MSTFGGFISEIEGISIDRFDGDNLKSKIFFLSHCHTDHMVGLNENLLNYLKENSRIYVSPISNVILNKNHPELSNFITPLTVNETSLIRIPSEINKKENYDNCISVTLMPAGHCPGSVMFLFEKPDGMRILYTGDFRISKQQLIQLQHLHNLDGSRKTIHKMYFDSTFWNKDYSYFPNRKQSCDFICSIISEWISKGNDYLISLSIPAKYGSEYLFKDIADRLKMPVHVNEVMFEIYSQISEMENCVTQNSISTQIHCCSTKWTMKRDINCRNRIDESKVRHIRPSALCWQSQRVDNPIFKEDENTFSVCYSSHCSYDELCDFLLYLKPEEIEPCVVPKDSICEFYKMLNEFSTKFGCKPCTYDLKNHIFDEFEEKITNLKTETKICLNVSLSDSDDEIYNKNVFCDNPKLNWKIKSTKSLPDKKIKLF